jgi:hypothetical protein
MCREGRYEDARRLASAIGTGPRPSGSEGLHTRPPPLGEYQKAIEVAEKMAQKDTESPWCKILAADLTVSLERRGQGLPDVPGRGPRM